MYPVKIYGADWCEDTQATRRHLEALHIPYDYHDVDAEPAAKQWVRDHNAGKQKTPTLDIRGAILSVPENDQLDCTLREKGLIVKEESPERP